MQKLYERWNSLLSTDEGEKLKKIICIDGKTMRGGKRKQEAETKPYCFCME